MRRKWGTKNERVHVITEAADYMINNNATLMDVENDLGMAHSSMWWYIQNVLQDIDEERAFKCKELLKCHIHHKKGYSRRIKK